MKEIRYFEANDGKRFESEAECVEYENRMTITQYKDDFKIFNCHRQEISINDENITQDDVYYIIVKSPAAADVIGEWFEYYGAYNPFESCGDWRDAVGTWAYDDDYHSEGWYKVEKKLDELQTILTDLKGE